MRTIEQLKSEALALVAASPKRAITITADELKNFVALTDGAKQSKIEGVPQLHSKFQDIVGKFSNTIPIKIPATEVLILTSL